MTNTQFLLRFDTIEEKIDFKVEATKQNKSMNQLLGELIKGYLRKVKKGN